MKFRGTDTERHAAVDSTLYSLACLPQEYLHGQRNAYEARYRRLFEFHAKEGELFDVLIGRKQLSQISGEARAMHQNLTNVIAGERARCARMATYDAEMG